MIRAQSVGKFSVPKNFDKKLSKFDSGISEMGEPKINFQVVECESFDIKMFCKFAYTQNVLDCEYSQEDSLQDGPLGC